MQRRDMLKASALGGLPLTAALTEKAFAEQPPPAAEGRNLPPLRITDVRTILTQPANIRLVVVKVVTNEPGLYGLGCAPFAPQRARVVETAVQQYLRPFLIGKNPLAIEDVFQSSFVSSYWRNGPVLGNALSGVDMALWDILGKRAGMPLYQLFGGKCRPSVETYCHTSGRTFPGKSETAVQASARSAAWRHPHPGRRCRGLSDPYGAGTTPGNEEVPINQRGGVWEPGPYVRTVPKLFEHMRRAMGDDVEFLHDTHERVPPILAMQLARDLEPYRPYFLEDPFSPEDVGYFEKLACISHHHAAGDGRAVQQPQRVRAADLRAADRLHPHPSVADRRPDACPQGGGVLRVLRRTHGLARPRRRQPGRSCGQLSSRHLDPELRHPGSPRSSRW